MNKIAIQDWTGKILGYVQTNSNGDKTVSNFYGVILGYYRKSQNITTDFYGRMISRGDTAVGLISLNSK
jgi:hypothetical protein